MYLRATCRKKDGKEHHYWSIVESYRTRNGRVSQRQVLYLGEINDAQKVSWLHTIEVLEEKQNQPRQVALFPDNRKVPETLPCDALQVRLSQLKLERPRQWGACWLTLEMWDRLQLDSFWSPLLPESREGTSWLNVLKTLTTYRLIDPGSEWRLHREWFRNSAIGDLLQEGQEIAGSDKLYRCLDKQYGKAQRVWVMDRGVPTEDILREMRESAAPVSYLVGTPRGRLSKLQQGFLQQSWEAVRSEVEIKILPQDKELYILARSKGRVAKERAMRQRKLKKLWKRLHELQQQKLTRDQLLIKLGSAKSEAGNAYRLVDIVLPEPGEDVKPETFHFSIDKAALRRVRQAEGQYLLRSFQCGCQPQRLWDFYIQLTEVEQAFKDLKQDLAIRPVFHQKDGRIEAHIFVAFIAYCLYVTLKQLGRQTASGLSPRSILEKFKTMQMIDVTIPTVDGRMVELPRYTQPDKDLQLLLHRMKLTLPAQPKPRVTMKGAVTCAAG